MNILLLIIILVLIIYCGYLQFNRIAAININTERQIENEKLEQENNKLKEQRQNINNDLLIVSNKVEQQHQILSSLQQTTESLKEEATQRAEEFYLLKLQDAEKNYTAAVLGYEEKQKSLNEQIYVEQQKLNDLQMKQLAYIQAQQRQEKINKQQDYYRLVITEDDKSDISLLRDIQKHLIKKDSIDKVIYENYYRSAYDILVSHLCDGTRKISGIYKITDLTTNQAYIGQSVDIRERWRTHIKTALSYGNTTNILYQTMKKSGIYNFTFEILEEVSRDKLNEREIYWIEFYKTKDFGLNSTKGGS